MVRKVSFLRDLIENLIFQFRLNFVECDANFSDLISDIVSELSETRDKLICLFKLAGMETLSKFDGLMGVVLLLLLD